jgi:iron complex transport system permease protein
MLASGMLCLLSGCVAVSVGETAIDWANLFDAQTSSSEIFFALRLPRVLLAAMVGAALSAAGATLQALLRNPLADPFVLGVSGGAGLGATVSLAFPMATLHPLLGLSVTSLAALLGACVATGLVLSLSHHSSQSALLSGVILNAFALAAIVFIKSLLAPNQLGEVLFWLAGSLGHETYSALLMIGALIALGLAGLVFYSPRLNLLSMGDDDAHTLGLNVPRTRVALLLLSSLVVAAAVSLAGLVGFVGLLIPHVVRLVVGADSRLVVPTSIFAGASFLMLADALARVLFQVFHSEPPVGVITAILGGPTFLYLMRKNHSKAAGFM